MSEPQGVADDVERVAEDRSLAPAEKQVSFTAAKAADEFTVHSEVASVTRGLLQHPDFEANTIRENHGDVVAVTGTLPISAVLVKGSSRKSTQWNQLVSTHTDDD